MRARTIYVIGAFAVAIILAALAQPAFAHTRICIQPETYQETPCPTITTEAPATTTTTEEAATTTTVNDYTGPSPTVTVPTTVATPAAPAVREFARTGVSDLLWGLGIAGAVALMAGLGLFHRSRP